MQSQKHLTLASPAGIQATTPGSTHLHSGESLAITTGENLSIASNQGLWTSLQKGTRLFVHKLGMHMVLGKNDISMQALQHSIKLVAAMNISETAQGDIEFIAKEQVSVQGGSSGTTWSAAGIEHYTEGTFDQKAGSHSLGAASGMAAPVMPALPVSAEVKNFAAKFDLLKNSAFFFSDDAPKVYLQEGNEITLLGTAMLNTEQKTQAIHTDEAATLVAFVGQSGWEINDHEHNDGDGGGCGCGAHDNEEETGDDE